MNLKKRNKKWLWPFLLALQEILCIVLLVIIAVRTEQMSKNNCAMAVIDVIAIVIMILCYRSAYPNRNESAAYKDALSIFFVTSVYLFTDGVYWCIAGDPRHNVANLLINTIYMMCPVVLVLQFWRLLDYWVERSQKFFSIKDFLMQNLGVIQILLIIGNVKGGYYFRILPDGTFERGPFHDWTAILPLLMVFVCMTRLVGHKMLWVKRSVLISFLMIPILAAVFQVIFPNLGVLSIGAFFGVSCLYFNFYLGRRMKEIEDARKLTESELRNMQMQLNPRMVQRMADTISELCETDPTKAKEYVGAVSSYFRENLKDVDRPNTATLEDELKQLDSYLDIETLQFPNIEVQKDIGPDSFKLPTMCMQALTENAILYGIAPKSESAGVIKISSTENEKAWIVRIEDDGVGREAAAPEDKKQADFIAENVQTRLRMLCDGNLEVYDRPEGGVTAEIQIPKQPIRGEVYRSNMSDW